MPETDVVYITNISSSSYVCTPDMLCLWKCFWNTFLIIMIILILIWCQEQKVPGCVELVEFRHGPRCLRLKQGFPMLACLEATIKLQSTNHHLYSPFQLCSLCNCTRTSWHVSIQVSFTWEDFSTVWTCCLPCVALHVVTQGSAVLESLATHRTMKWTGLFGGVVPISWLTPKSDYNKVMCTF